MRCVAFSSHHFVMDSVGLARGEDEKHESRLWSDGLFCKLLPRLLSQSCEVTSSAEMYTHVPGDCHLIWMDSSVLKMLCVSFHIVDVLHSAPAALACQQSLSDCNLQRKMQVYHVL